MVQQDLSGMRFLITEDNLLCADILAELLRLRHASVSCVHSGEEAVRRIGEAGEEYDAVLMDVQMPGMNGYEATRAIRALTCGAKVPVFAMTASMQESDRYSSQLAGMNAFLHKPLEMAMLDQALACISA